MTAFTAIVVVAALLAGINGCDMPSGSLSCNSREQLTPGSSFTISSKVCDNGLYPKREKCGWYFDVSGCKPTLSCEEMDVKGRQRKCKGDKLRVETQNKRKNYCRDMLVKKPFTDDEPTNFFDIKFKSNRRQEGTGFKCTVTCSGDASTSTTTPPGSSDCSCGATNRKRIVGGQETKQNEYPWQVALSFSSGSGSQFCGGSILSSKTIITAAHCLIGETTNSFNVVVGEHDLTEADGEETFSVCNMKIHPEYNSDTNDHDVAILTLCNPLTFRREVSPVCLPSQTGDAYDDVEATVTGWGTLFAGGPSPDVLNGVNVRTIGNAECGGNYGGGIIKGSMICAKDQGKDACQGDSGGPMTTLESGQYASLIGVVSFGVGCADPNFPGVYARVTHDLQFINENIEGTQCSPANAKRSFRRKINDFDIDES